MKGKKVGDESHCDPLEMGTERKERAQQKFCYRDGDELRGIAFGGEEREMMIYSQPICFSG